MSVRSLRASILGATVSTFALAAAAQEAPPPPPADAGTSGGVELEEIVVTGVSEAQSLLRSSVSVSTLAPEEIAQFAPRNTAEIFRNIPGIRSEASGGEGNANIAVRGLPVASGGAKFLQLHEDGLPVLEFGDIAFGNADIFLRADATVARVEAIRGGSASTFASNSPGGVINFISKTGEEQGGSFGLTRGLDFDSTRGDFAFGAPIGDDWAFHIGGFYRQGEGPRDSDYTAEKGGQVKANLTRNFENGYARVYVKHLNDRAISFLPMPVRVTGTNSDPDFDSLPGFDIKDGTIQSPFFLSNPGLDGNNNRRTSDIRDGMRPISTAVGGEFSFELPQGFTLTDRIRVARNKGRFVSPFPAEVGAAQELANDIGGAGSTLRYASGPNRGQVIANPAALNGNGLAMQVALFDVEINSFDNFANDLKLAKELELGAGVLDITAGYYKSRQEIDMDWLWNQFLLEVNGDRAALLDVVNAAGVVQTANGQVAYGIPAFGNCCTRSYNTEYDIDAPYLSLAYELDRLNLDASVRYDKGKARGNYAAAVQAANVDVDGNGVISVPERSVSVIDNANPQPVRYGWHYWSWSVGANYRVTDDLSVFARASRGGRANADRLLFGRVQPDGSVSREDAIDLVDQYEGGVKWRYQGLSLFATAFYAETEEQNFEATSQRFFDRVYEAKGIELEGSYSYDGFGITVGATYTDAEISEDDLTPDVVGNTPRRQADLVYQITPSYRTDLWGVGANIVGTTKSYAQDSNQLELPAYTQVNLFADVTVTEGLTVSLNVNNLFDVAGYTEAEEGSIVEGADNIIRARSINGRTTSVSLRYAF